MVCFWVNTTLMWFAQVLFLCEKQLQQSFKLSVKEFVSNADTDKKKITERISFSCPRNMDLHNGVSRSLSVPGLVVGEQWLWEEHPGAAAPLEISLYPPVSWRLADYSCRFSAIPKLSSVLMEWIQALAWGCEHQCSLCYQLATWCWHMWLRPVSISSSTKCTLW